MLRCGYSLNCVGFDVCLYYCGFASYLVWLVWFGFYLMFVVCLLMISDMFWVVLTKFVVLRYCDYIVVCYYFGFTLCCLCFYGDFYCVVVVPIGCCLVLVILVARCCLFALCVLFLIIAILLESDLVSFFTCLF